MKSVEVVAILLAVLAYLSSEIFAQSQNEDEKLEFQTFPNFSPTCVYRERDFWILTKALANGLNFFNENFNKLVMDAGVGTAIIERQIGVILNSKQVPKDVSNILRKLMETAENITNQIAEKIRTDETVDELHRNKSLPWVTAQSLWKTPMLGQWHNLNLNQAMSLDFQTYNTAGEAIEEERSDFCIGQLFIGCKLSDDCREIFVNNIYTKYSLTHQVIFHHIANEMCIGNEAFPMEQHTWTKLLNSLCSQVFLEAKSIEAQNFPFGFQDLFAEQVIVCGITGFANFLQPTWMYEILMWQHELSDDMACFTFDYDSSHDNSHERRRREKRSDRTISTHDNKCSVHFSSVGMGALAVHLRHFLETCI